MQGWTTEHPFDEGAWHAAQSGLWTIMGESDSYPVVAHCQARARLRRSMTTSRWSVKMSEATRDSPSCSLAQNVYASLVA